MALKLMRMTTNLGRIESKPIYWTTHRYTIPAIGIWLYSPVPSMIETAAVGLLSGTAQQAALNPVVDVMDNH